MRPATILMLVAVVGTACLMLTAAATAQCGATINSNPIPCCGTSDHANSDCSGSGGDPDSFCFLSFGNCCGVEYSLANVHPDTKCSPISQNFSGGASYRPGVLPAGSCSGHHVAAGQMLASLEPLTSHAEFVIRERLNFEVGQ